MNFLNMEEAVAEQKVFQIKGRTHSGMINYGCDGKHQNSREIGLTHKGPPASASDNPRERTPTGTRVWNSDSSELKKPRRKMEHNKYDPGSEIFARSLGIRWQTQMKTPMYRPPPPNPRSSFSSCSQKFMTSNFLAKSPPPLLHHPALLKNLNGRVSNASLITEYGRRVNSMEKPRHTMYNSIPHSREALTIQSAKNTRCFTGETFQSLLVSRHAPAMRKDLAIHKSVFSQRHPVYKRQLGLQGQPGMLKRKLPSHTIDLLTPEQPGYNSGTAGDMQPINLCKTQDSLDAQPPGEELNKETTAIEPGRTTAQCSTKVESGESSKYRRFLLIDTKGMPYTVLMEEPKLNSKKEFKSFDGGFSVSNSRGASEGSSAPRKMYSCPICSRVFEYLSYLQRHSITHSEQKPYVCDTCGKAFKRTSHLERHKYTHTMGKPFDCQICKRSFRDSGELAHHHRVHTGERPYQCKMCHMRFGERSTLQRHLQRKHSKQPHLLDSFTDYVSD